MKKILGLLFTLFVISSFFWPSEPSHGAGMSTGHTWTNGELMTATKLNLMVNGGTVTNITTGDFADLAVTLSKMAADSVNSSKIVNNSVTGGASGDLATNTVTTQNILAGSLTGREFTNTVNFATGTYNFTNSSVNFTADTIASSAILGTNASSGTSQAGLVPKLNSQGKLDNSLYYAPRATNIVLSSAASASTALATLLTHTASITNGTVSIHGVVQYTNSSTGGGTLYVVVDSSISGNLYSGGMEVTSADPEGWQIPFSACETLQNVSSVTYTVKAKESGSGGGWAKTGTLPNSAFPITNATRMTVIEIPAP